MTPYALDHPAVAAYLQRLDAATAHLPEDERIEIQEGIRSHLIAALAEAHTDADMHQALDALGAPEEIVGLTAPGTAPLGPMGYVQPPPQQPRSARGALEIVAVIFLLLGAFVVPLVGWIIGVVLLWLSKAWTTGEKVLATILVPAGLALPFLAFFISPFAMQSCVSVEGPVGVPLPDDPNPLGGPALYESGPACSGIPPWLIPLGIAVIVVASIAMSIYLLRVAGRREASA